MIIAYRILIRKAKGKMPLGRPGHRFEDNLKLILMYGGALVNMMEIFFLLIQWLFAFCYVVSVMKFDVFWDVTAC